MSGLVQKPLRGEAQWMVKTRVVVDHCNHKIDIMTTFFLNASKQKHNTNYEGTAALRLHKYQDSFGATLYYQWEKPKMLPAKRSRWVSFVSSCILLLLRLVSFISNICVTLRGRIKEAARTLRKQDPALPENCALNRCEVCFKQVWSVL